MDPFTEEDFEFELEEKKKLNFPTKIVVVIVILIFFISPVLFQFSSYWQNKDKATSATKKPDNSNDKTIYDIKDTLEDKTLAKKANYVKVDYDSVYYARADKGLIIYQNSNKEDDLITIKIDYIINENNNKIEIASCYNSNVSIENSLNSCLKEDTDYIVSKNDKAIISIKIFYKHYYGKQKI